jgi:hypothetical protein
VHGPTRHNVSAVLPCQCDTTKSRACCVWVSLFAWLISHQPAVLFSHNKSATSNQPAVLFSLNKSAPAISHQPNEQAHGTACRHATAHGSNNPSA